ncbi:MAG: endonuclease MutS2 [Candidatus Izimaplasma sp.]|nr:endonuclease MutS2 [Candidatus Izimaplasma bacterium]
MYAESQLLEFDKVLKRITTYAHTTVGKEKVLALAPTNNDLIIKRQLDEVNQAKQIVEGYKEAPFGGVRDVTDILKQAKIYATLTPKDFLNIVGLVEASKHMVRFFEQVTENELVHDALDPYIEDLSFVKAIKDEIMQVITIDGKIRDDASSELSRIRRNISSKERKINDKLNQFLNAKKNKLTESLITIRSNRFVVPVKASEKNTVKGTVVDVSSSGETVYIEPASVAEINNQVSLLKIEEQNEMEKILRDLTSFVAGYHDILKTNFDVLTTLDYIFAVAKYSIDMLCIKPNITDTTIDLQKARHPLIHPEEVVANTITFNPGEDTIIITGPNTGGKTVALKTMGLLSIMVQSGLLIPVEPESKTIIFNHIFADIGDEQSIEQSLSTFSSHMTRIIKIIKQCTPGSLILLDELGSGTDPKEGSSLAMAILDHITQFNVYTIATTHYPELKAYAYDKDHIVNASVEFDVDTLSPTYRLLLGTPGKSNALLISERLGLPKSVINQAKDHVITSNTDVSDLITKLEKQGNVLDQKIQEYDRLIARNKELIEDNKRLKRELREQKDTLREKASLEKHKLLTEAKREAENLINEIEDLLKASDIKPHQLAELKHKTKDLSQEEIRDSETKEHTYQAGDLVTVLKFNRTGELIDQQKNGKWTVKMGSLSLNLEEEDFEFIEQKTLPKQTVSVKSKVKKFTPTTLDLRGMRYEEANIALDKYIDDCLLSNVPKATIIHGFGTLTLRKLVKSYVENHPQIASYRDGKGNEGGNGATVIELKN